MPIVCSFFCILKLDCVSRISFVHIFLLPLNKTRKCMNRQELITQIFQKKSFLCVGLDTDVEKIPAHLQASDDSIFEFNKAIIDATAPFCVAYKPNLAFYECYGLKGLQAFERTIDYLKVHYPKHFVIADAKRGDIGNTSTRYAKTFFETYAVDALTVAPYMGEDSVKPFLGYPEKWVIVLALTSNPGSKDFQFESLTTGQRLFEKVLETSRTWGSDEHMMYVVGATQGKLFEDIRRVVPHHFLLVPGVGAQGGSLQEVCKYGMTKDCGLLVNSSRGILYASTGQDFAEAAAAAAQQLQQEMAQALALVQR